MSDISNDGSTVVGWLDTGAGLRAYRWKLGVGIAALQRPSLEPVQGAALVVSSDGTRVLGHDKLPGQDAGQPFLWTEGMGLQYLDSLPGPPFDMSADGTVFVGNVESMGASTGIGYRWSEEDGVTLIESSPETNGGWLGVTAVSDDGTTVVGSQGFADSGSGSSISRAYRWTEGSGTVDLGVLDGHPEYVGSSVDEVSSDGSIIVGGPQSSAVPSQIYRWTEATGIQGLGFPTGGDFGNGARDITPDGKFIVGVSRTSDPTAFEPIIWDEARGFRSLRAIIEAETGMLLSGWDLENAYAISADGTVIGGSGTNPDGKHEAWVMLFEPQEIDAPLGDYNRDGHVDASDYTVWRDHLGKLLTKCSGADANCNGFIDNLDYLVWNDDFGQTVLDGAGSAAGFPPAEATRVPESSSLLIAVAGACSLLLMRRWRSFGC